MLALASLERKGKGEEGGECSVNVGYPITKDVEKVKSQCGQ